MHGEWMFVVEWVSVSGTDLLWALWGKKNLSMSPTGLCHFGCFRIRGTSCHPSDYTLWHKLSIKHTVIMSPSTAANGGQSELPQYALDVKRADSNGPRAAEAVYRLKAQQRWIKMSRLSSHRRCAVPFHSVVRWLARVKGCMKKKLP